MSRSKCPKYLLNPLLTNAWPTAHHPRLSIYSGVDTHNSHRRAIILLPPKCFHTRGHKTDRLVLPEGARPTPLARLSLGCRAFDSFGARVFGRKFWFYLDILFRFRVYWLIFILLFHKKKPASISQWGRMTQILRDSWTKRRWNINHKWHALGGNRWPTTHVADFRFPLRPVFF